MPRIARRPYQPRDVTQQPLRAIGEAQLLKILHFPADDALVHRFVQWNQRLLEEAPQALSDQQLGQVVLQLADAVLAEQGDRSLDFVGKRGRCVDRDAQHRLQRRFGQRHDGPGAPALGQ
jgi:hypothetical protein